MHAEMMADDATFLRRDCAPNVAALVGLPPKGIRRPGERRWKPIDVGSSGLVVVEKLGEGLCQAEMMRMII